MTERFETTIAAHRTVAETALMEAVGAGGSLCAIGRSGRSFPAVKYHEGAVAALSEAGRTTHDRTELALLAERWRGGGSGPTADAPDWVAYRAGGAEALEAVLGDL